MVLLINAPPSLEDVASERIQDSVPGVDCTEAVDGCVFTSDEIKNDCESGSEAEDMPDMNSIECDDNSDSETEDVWQYYEFDSDNDATVDQNTSENSMEGTTLKDHQCTSGHAATMLDERSSLTVAASSVVMMNLKMKHNLTDTCMEDIVKLVKFHCPTPNNCVRSV